MAIRAALLAAAAWLRSRAFRMDVSPVSADWLLDFERQSIRERKY
jgi:hypothetical protein